MTEQAHPEDANPLGDSHERSAEERGTIFLLSIFLVGTLIAVPIIAVIGRFPTINVFVGLLQLLATLILDIVVTAHHYKRETYWGILIICHVLGLAVVWLLSLALFWPVNTLSAVSFSFVFGVLFTLAAWYVGGRPHPQKHVVEFHPEKLDEYIQSIEDKAKGLNFAIGRVYRSSNGGSAALRDKIKIRRDWYNEFYELNEAELDNKHQHKVDKAKVLLHQILDRLRLLGQKERVVFSQSELKKLKNLKRNEHGEDAVIDVLQANDNDPVEHYYVSAVDFCERIIEELERL